MNPSKQKPHELVYLKNEINELKLENEELKQLNLINKQVIELQNARHKNDPHFRSILRSIYESLNTQAHKIATLIDQRNETNGKVLVFQKMMEDAQENERTNFEVIRDHVQSMRQYVADRELKIRMYEEKLGEVDYLASLVTKYIHVSSPTEQAVSFKDEINHLNGLILFQNEAMDRINKEKEGLLKINLALKNEIQRKNQDIEKIKESSVLIQSNSILGGQHGNVLDTSLQMPQHSQVNMSMSMSAAQRVNSSFSFLKFQRNIIEQESDSDFDPDNLCPQLAVMFPDKVTAIRANRRQIPIPSLNMQRVRTIMKKNRAKIDDDLKKNAHINPTQKIMNLEKELDYTRKLLSQLTLDNKTLENTNQRLEKYVAQVEARNHMLVQGYQKLKDNWQKIFSQFFKYRKLYEQCQRFMRGQPEEQLQSQESPVVMQAAPRQHISANQGGSASVLAKLLKKNVKTEAQEQLNNSQFYGVTTHRGYSSPADEVQDLEKCDLQAFAGTLQKRNFKKVKNSNNQTVPEKDLGQFMMKMFSRPIAKARPKRRRSLS